MSHEVVVQLIGVTTTRAGLTVNAKLDKRQYPTKLEVTAKEMASVKLGPYTFHEEWNYAIRLSRVYLPASRWSATQGLLILLFPPNLLMSDWLIPSNQSASLSASSQH